MPNLTLKNLRGADLKGPVELAVADREFVVLTGGAGSGASQIIRLVAGLDEASEGEILFDDRPVADLPPKNRDVALLSGDYTPYQRMSVSQNLAIALEGRGFAKSEIKKRIAAAAETLGLGADLAASPESLSPEKQRSIGLARTVVRQPKLYLFDEPFAGLDRASAARGRSVIAALRQRSTATILYATSDPAEALGFGARTIVFERGAPQQDGEAQAIFEAPVNLSVAKFFGDPPMNLVAGTLKRERDSLVFREKGDGTITVRWNAGEPGDWQAASDGAVVLGFHAHAVEVTASGAVAADSATVFRALVDRAESRGGGTDLYLRTGEHELVIRSGRWGASDQAGHRFEFGLDRQKARLFDPVSGRLITREP